jgi:hypothetical protein
MNHLLLSTDIVYSVPNGFDVLDQLEGGFVDLLCFRTQCQSLKSDHSDYSDGHCLLLRAAKKEEILRICIDVNTDITFLEIVLTCREYIMSPFEIVMSSLNLLKDQKNIEGFIDC